MSYVQWNNYQGLTDPRIRVALLLAGFLVIGIGWLGINKTPEQVVFILVVGCMTDMLLHRVLRSGEGILFPISAVITCLGLSILTSFAHTLWLGAIPIFIAISSKYLMTANGRHVFNPGLFGLVACLLFTDGLISPASSSQWGGEAVMVSFFIFTALSLFLFNVSRVVLTCSFLLLYGLQLTLRSYVLDTGIPPLTLIDGVLRNPAFYLFTYFMLTDPRTSPGHWKGQVGMAIAIVCFDLLLHLAQFTFTLFYAGALYYALRWLWLQQAMEIGDISRRLIGKMKAIMVIACLAVGGYSFYSAMTPQSVLDVPSTSFTLTKIPTNITGISARPGRVLGQVDPRIRHVAKWFFSMGDAVAISDVNQDGLPDMFLTLPLKANEDRAQLYLNQGGFHFTKHPIPALDFLRNGPVTEGVAMDALWFDEDNDGDQDLLLMRYGGSPLLLQNQLAQTGELIFINVTSSKGLDHMMNSATANVLDINRDGRLDIIAGGTLSAHHLGYEDRQVPLNLFALPRAESESDRRALDVMRRNPFDARNGGENRIFLHSGSEFVPQDNVAWGITDERRWTLDIGTGDINNDGWTDLYFSNTAGPDKLLVNLEGEAFSQIKGWKKHQLGNDTYRGMNASFADFNADGFEDIYVSNMHKREVPEGSMLWVNQGGMTLGVANFVDQAFASNIFNHGRFGWGAAVGDLNRDGTLDVLQMNGWIDDAYDEDLKREECADYVYKMFQVEFAPPQTHGYADNWPDMRGECLYPKEAKRVWLNDGNAHFTDVAQKVGWAALDNSKGTALADFDNDGDLDVVVTRMTAPPSIYENKQLAAPYWLGVSLEGDGKRCNRNAFGTKVEVSYREKNGHAKVQTRYAVASNGLSAQSDSRLLFGFGMEKPEDIQVKLHWCGHAMAQSVENLPLNYYHQVTVEK